MDKAVQCAQVLTINAQKVVGFARQRPSADNFRLQAYQPRESGRGLRPVSGHLHLHEGLHRQTKARRVQPRRIRGDQALGLKPLAAATGLTCRQVQLIPKFLRSQMGIALQQRQKALVQVVKVDAGFLHDLFQ